MKFKARISRMGDRLIINIPTSMSEEITPYLGNKIIVELHLFLARK